MRFLVKDLAVFFKSFLCKKDSPPPLYKNASIILLYAIYKDHKVGVLFLRYLAQVQACLV